MAQAATRVVEGPGPGLGGGEDAPVDAGGVGVSAHDAFQRTDGLGIAALEATEHLPMVEAAQVVGG